MPSRRSVHPPWLAIRAPVAPAAGGSLGREATSSAAQSQAFAANAKRGAGARSSKPLAGRFRRSTKRELQLALDSRTCVPCVLVVLRRLGRHRAHVAVPWPPCEWWIFGPLAVVLPWEHAIRSRWGNMAASKPVGRFVGTAGRRGRPPLCVSVAAADGTAGTLGIRRLPALQSRPAGRHNSPANNPRRTDVGLASVHVAAGRG